ncbi:hypothetical protein P692DRAFT_20831948 [Suillus brevipes Sb2]|nr:hypothetical protein P692DRAFT_20831948 [Suillus brevipes Sb2]
MEEKRIMEPGKVECMTSRTFCLIGICLGLLVSTQNRHRWLQYEILIRTASRRGTMFKLNFEIQTRITCSGHPR